MSPQKGQADQLSFLNQESGTEKALAFTANFQKFFDPFVREQIYLQSGD